MANDDALPFGPDEWSACLKVLAALGDRPEAAPDREVVERLVARLYRKTRRGRRKATDEARARADRATVEATGRVRASSDLERPATEPARGGHLQARARLCYVCKDRYRAVDPYYHQLCPECARQNHAKRVQRADLTGRRALVTGGRIKIGRAVALKLLRDGAEVRVTTRFPAEAALRYAREPDFAAWEARLQIDRLDGRSMPDVVAFADRLVLDQPALDILVNNAAQTVRRPPGHFAGAEALDRLPLGGLPANIRGVLGVRAPAGLPDEVGAGSGLTSPLAPVALPVDGPPDLREANSWTARLDEVGPVELLEALLVNAAAPFLLIGRLKPLLLRSSFPDRYIINVAGLDGQFGRGFKTDRHPHVNMSKAALNMITRTSAADYARDGIFMNSVDAGWVSHEAGHSARVRLRAQGFVPPLDEVDAAARICDPIARGVGGHRPFGQFFKDFQPTGW